MKPTEAITFAQKRDPETTKPSTFHTLDAPWNSNHKYYVHNMSQRAAMPALFGKKRGGEKWLETGKANQQ